MRGYLKSLAVCASLVAGGAAVGQQLDPESREYKLMLEPTKFGGNAPGKAVDQLWEQRLKPVIEKSLDPRNAGEARHDGSFQESKHRQIVFRDTADCVLSAHGYTLRERTKFKDGQLAPKSRETTLKLRSPDNIIVASARSAAPDPKFEEDIAPLLVRVVDGSSRQTRAAYARPPSMRSMFSLSIDEEPRASNRLATFADAVALYPDIRKRLQVMGAPDIDADAELKKGPVFEELVFDGASVDLGHGLKAGFDLSLWYAEGTLGSGSPEIAELSFKYKVEDVKAVAPAARRALTLFKALQERLEEWASPDAETKTAAALPKGC